MTRQENIQRITAAFVLLFCISCDARSDGTGGREPVTVYTAASLADVIEASGDRFELTYAGAEILPVLGGSSTLARQIESGAEADLFLSADREWMDYLVVRGHIDGESRVESLGNRLVLVMGQDVQPEVRFRGVEDVLTREGLRIAMADPEAVPAGRYARDVLTEMGVWDGLRERVILAPDVRVALAYADQGEVDAAIVYATDGRMARSAMLYAALPGQARGQIRYSFAAVRADPPNRHARAFLEFLKGEEAQQIFQEAGFLWSDSAPVSSQGGETIEESEAGPAPDLQNEDLSILRLSFLVAVYAMLICFPFALFFGWFLARKQVPGQSLFEHLINLPLVLPPAVTGFLLLVLLGQNGILGRWMFHWFGLQVAFTQTAAVLAAAVVSFPLVVQSIRLAVESVDPGLERVAQTLGSSPWRVFLTVTLPLAAPGVVAGVAIGFARSLGELGATLVFAGNIPGQTQTLPLAVWSRVSHMGGESAAIRLVLISVVVSYLSLFLAGRLHRKLRNNRERSL